MIQKNELTASDISRMVAEFHEKGGKVQKLAAKGFPRHVRRGFGAVLREGERN